MKNLASTTEIVEGFSFLLKPDFNPINPVCRRCKTKLTQHIKYEGEEVEIEWVCGKCGKSIMEAGGC